MHVSALLDVDLLAVDADDEVTVMLDFTAPAPPKVVERPPATLQVVLDRSRSMRGGKLAGVVEALRALVDRLDPRDNFGLVSFDDQAMVEVPAGPLADKNSVRAAIDGLRASGMTDLSSGLLRGLQEARRVAGKRGGRLLLVSDGHANRGVTEHVLLGEIARGGYRAGITVSTLGYGLGFDEELLGAVADGGAGDALFARDPDAAGALIAEQVENLLSKVVQAASLTIEMGGAVREARLLGDLPVTVTADGGVMVELGDFYAGEARRLLVKLSVPGVSALGLAEIAQIKVTYVESATLTSYEVAVPVVVNVVPADQAAGRVPDATVRTEVALWRAQEAKREASEELRRGRRRAASDRLMAARAELAARLASAPPEQRSEIEAEVAAMFALSRSSLTRDLRRTSKEAYQDWHDSTRGKRERMRQMREARERRDREDGPTD